MLFIYISYILSRTLYLKLRESNLYIGNLLMGGPTLTSKEKAHGFIIHEISPGSAVVTLRLKNFESKTLQIEEESKKLILGNTIPAKNNSFQIIMGIDGFRIKYQNECLQFIPEEQAFKTEQCGDILEQKFDIEDEEDFFIQHSKHFGFRRLHKLV